jgi:hypothetical protein
VFLKCQTLTYEWILGNKYVNYVGYVSEIFGTILSMKIEIALSNAAKVLSTAS